MLIPFDQLFRRYDIRPAGVLHLGANDGAEADAYAAQGIRRVVWVEAIPEIADDLRDRLREKYPGHLVLSACVSDHDGFAQKPEDWIPFHVASNAGQSSSFLDLGTHARRHPTVRYVRDISVLPVRVNTLLRRHGLQVGPHWFLNMDLQGTELHALRGMDTLLGSFDWIYGEVNQEELYRGCALIGEIDAYLTGFGFVRIETKMTGSGWGDALYARPETRDLRGMI